MKKLSLLIALAACAEFQPKPELPGVPVEEAKPVAFYPCQEATFWWAVMMAESGGNPRSTYKEPAPLNVYSLGLYQLSVEDTKYYPGCNLYTKEDAYDPAKNENCKNVIVAKLRKKHPTENWSQALGRYWSVLRWDRYWPTKKQSGYLRFKKYAAQKGCKL